MTTTGTMDLEGFREAARSSIDEIVGYYQNIADRRVVSSVKPGYLRELVPSKPPVEAEQWKDIQKDVEAKIMPGITHWQSPNFMAFFPCSSSFPGMLGEMYSSAFNGSAFNWICSPAVTELETIVTDWLADMFNLPETYRSSGSTLGGGVIHGTASEAILTVMVAARDKYLREATEGVPEDQLDDAMADARNKLVAFGSATTHSSTKKAAQVSGVRFMEIPVSAKNNFALTGGDVKAAVEKAHAKGLTPFYLTATLGTTDCCAYDDFESIADALQEVAPPGKGEVWVHVDAAYAGAALVCPEYHHFTAQFHRFHSFNMNLHKWLLTNFDCSVTFVQKRSYYIDAFSMTPPYLRNNYSESGLVTDYRDWQIPLGRRFRSLKVWFVIRTFGVKGLQEHIRKGIRHGDLFTQLVKGRSDLFEIVAVPRFALVVLRLKGASSDDQNALTEKLYTTINEEGKIYLTSTVLDGSIYAIRFCLSTPFVEEVHVRDAFDTLVKTTEMVSGALKGLNAAKL
ncbi:hypothetical protein MRS44_002053 [Fusarium solani]|uniref:uncharacterized protein n=1 Tax=Fusarium solani TaxID=169388 RepID=UPI00231ED4F8|nr:hypothetical protein MRS44_002053 [Fusarium solani]KAJ4200790.1 hypothetical protein NW759_015816 [Fusarium solani]